MGHLSGSASFQRGIRKPSAHPLKPKKRAPNGAPLFFNAEQSDLVDIRGLDRFVIIQNSDQGSIVAPTAIRVVIELS